MDAEIDFFVTFLSGQVFVRFMKRWLRVFGFCSISVLIFGFALKSVFV